MAERAHKTSIALTGTATTGHEWDGIRELNTPLPRWWLWMFYATIVWAIGYWIVYPAWPLLTVVDARHLRLALAQRGRRRPRRAQGAARADDRQARQRVARARSCNDPQLLDFARAQGRVAFADNCAPCHGAGGGGAKGYPNLNDDDWLWGGKLAEIEQTIRHGARSGDDKAHQGNMPAFGRDGILKPDEISAVADFVRSLSGLPTEKGADLALGKKVFADNCAALSRRRRQGQPRARRAQSDRQDLALRLGQGDHHARRLQNGRGGVMPAWDGRLSDPTIKALAVYVYSFGGGEK